MWWLAVGNTAGVVVVSSREYCMCGGAVGNTACVVVVSSREYCRCGGG